MCPAHRPAWVAEALSHATRRIGLDARRALCAREGIPEFWFADPDARALEGFARREGPRMLLATLADDASVALPPFDGIRFPLDELGPAGATADDDAARSCVGQGTGTFQDRSHEWHPCRPTLEDSSAGGPSQALRCRSAR